MREIVTPCNIMSDICITISLISLPKRELNKDNSRHANTDGKNPKVLNPAYSQPYIKNYRKKVGKIAFSRKEHTNG